MTRKRNLRFPKQFFRLRIPDSLRYVAGLFEVFRRCRCLLLSDCKQREVAFGSLEAPAIAARREDTGSPGQIFAALGIPPEQIEQLPDAGINLRHPVCLSGDAAYGRCVPVGDKRRFELALQPRNVAAVGKAGRNARAILRRLLCLLRFERLKRTARFSERCVRRFQPPPP